MTEKKSEKKNIVLQVQKGTVSANSIIKPQPKKADAKGE